MYTSISGCAVFVVFTIPSHFLQSRRKTQKEEAAPSHEVSLVRHFVGCDGSHHVPRWQAYPQGCQGRQRFHLTVLPEGWVHRDQQLDAHHIRYVHGEQQPQHNQLGVLS